MIIDEEFKQNKYVKQMPYKPNKPIKPNMLIDEKNEKALAILKQRYENNLITIDEFHKACEKLINNK